MNNTSAGWCSGPREAAYCREHFPAQVQSTLSIADDVRANSFTFRDHWEMERTNVPVVFPAGQIEWEQIPAGDIEWVYALNRHTCLLNLAKAYHYTGREEYAQQFAALADHWLTHVPFREESKSKAWRSLETGLRAENWLRAMELLEGCPLFTPQLRQRMEDSLRQHAAWLLEAGGTFQMLSNWGVLQDHGLFLIGIFLERPDWVETALNRLYQEVQVQTFADGSQWEQSPMYHCEVFHCLLDTVLIARRARITLDAAFEERIHQMGYALAVWCKPDGHMPCQSDSDDMDARDLIAQAALLFQDGTLKWHAHEQYYEENVWTFGEQAAREYQELPSIPPKQASAALPDSGNYMLRSDLSRDASWLHFHCGCMGSGHGHCDQLHIDLAAYGEDILIDPGRFTYVDSPIRRTLKSSASHNTTRVDGVDFSIPLESWNYTAMAMPVKGEYRFTSAADYVSGAHLGYQALPAGGIFASRKIIFIKPDIWMVFDAFYGAGRHTLEQNFYFGITGQASGIPDGAEFFGTHARSRIQCLGGGLTLEMDRHPASREYNRMEECDHLKVTREAQGFGWFTTVLSASPAGGEECAHAELVPVSLHKAGTLLTEDQVQGVRVTKGGREYCVMVCHEEVINGVDLISAGGKAGYGKVLVFGNGLPEHGLCLAW